MRKVLSNTEQSQSGTPYLLDKWKKADFKHLSEGVGQEPGLSVKVWTRMLLLVKAKVSMNPRKGAKLLEKWISLICLRSRSLALPCHAFGL